MFIYSTNFIKSQNTPKTISYSLKMSLFVQLVVQNWKINFEWYAIENNSKSSSKKGWNQRMMFVLCLRSYVIEIYFLSVHVLTNHLNS